MLFIQRKNRQVRDTEIGVSPITHRRMREHKARMSNDAKITADYVPVRHNANPAAYVILIFMMMLLGVFGRGIGKSIYSNLRYQSHVEKICERVAPTKRGYDWNVTSNHPALIEKHGPKIPKTLRVRNGKELCGHD